MTVWFNKKINNDKKYYSKLISLNFYPQHWKIFSYKTNGAKKGVKEDVCLDINLWFLGVHLSYTNFDYNEKLYI